MCDLMSDIKNMGSDWNGNEKESLKKNVFKLHAEPWLDRIVKWDLIEKPNTSNALLLNYEIKKRVWKMKPRPTNFIQCLPRELVAHVLSFL